MCFVFLLTQVALSDGTWKEIERLERSETEDSEIVPQNDNLNGTVSSDLNGTETTTESDLSKVWFVF